MKKFLSLIMTFIIVLSIVPMTLFSASAASVVPSGAKEYNGHTYYVFKKNVSWKKAKALCESKGGHLATITSAKENKFVAKLIDQKGKGYYWLGGYDSSKEGTWKWVTGERFKYKAWAYNQPDNSTAYDKKGEDYLQTFTSSNVWNDAGNSPSGDSGADTKGYVCEWDMSKKAASSARLISSAETVYYKGSTTLKVLNTEKTVKWSTSNKKVAKVSSKGKVTGVGLGTCTITAKVGSKKLKCKITVKDRNSKAAISFKTNGGGYFVKGISVAKVVVKPKSYDCAKATVYIQNSSGDTVYKKTLKKLTKGEKYSFTWNGKNSDGDYVSSGSYRVVVKIGSKKSYSSYLAFRTTNDFAGGNGTKANPFLVASTSQLKKIVKYPNAYFKQTKNLDFNYTAAGSFFSADNPFNGVYDGNGKTIMNISGTSALFDTVGEKGTIKNLKVKSCSVVGDDLALLAKYNYGKINSCNINGTVTAAVDRASSNVGLIAYYNYGTISNCVTSGTASSTCTSGFVYARAGGIVECNEESGKIISCVSHANVKTYNGYVNNDYLSIAGGIASRNKGVINGCEADGAISATSYSHGGGYQGGIAGENNGQIIDCCFTGNSSLNLVHDNTGIIA